MLFRCWRGLPIRHLIDYPDIFADTHTAWREMKLAYYRNFFPERRYTVNAKWALDAYKLTLISISIWKLANFKFSLAFWLQTGRNYILTGWRRKTNRLFFLFSINELLLKNYSGQWQPPGKTETDTYSISFEISFDWHSNGKTR